MLLVKARSCLLAIFLLTWWNSAYRLTVTRKFASCPFNYLSLSDSGFRYRKTTTSIFLTIPSFDDDYYQTSQSSSNDLSPSDIFLSLLESQLAIIVQSTNITHAAIYMNSENDESRDGDEQSVMQLVCSYPPPPRSLQSDDMTDIQSGGDDFDAFDKSSADGMGTKKGGSVDSSIPSNRSQPGQKTEGNRWNPFSAVTSSTDDDDLDGVGASNINAVKEDIEIDGDTADFDNDDVIKEGWAGSGGESISTVYPIQFQGLNLGILQTVINKAFMKGDVTQNIPVFDFYDFQSSSQSSSWNPYKSDNSPAGCAVCESVVVAMGTAIALELIRISSLAEAKRNSRMLKEREDNAFLRSSSAVITTKTLLKLLSKRLPKDDDIGLEIIKTINDQSDSISEAILRLIKPPMENSNGYLHDEEEEGDGGGEEDDIGDQYVGSEVSVESAEVREWLELEKDKDALEGILDAISAEENLKEVKEKEEDEDETVAVLADGDTDTEEDEEEGSGGVAVRGGEDDGLDEFPFVVTTVQIASVHAPSPTHDAHTAGGDADEEGDCATARTADRSFFFAETESTRDPSSSNTHLARHEIPRDGDVVAEGVDFLFLETFVSKEKEVFVTFEMSAVNGATVAKGVARKGSSGSKAVVRPGRSLSTVSEVEPTEPSEGAREPIEQKKRPPKKRKKRPPLP